MPLYVVRWVDNPETGRQKPLADRDVCATTTGYSAVTIRMKCRPVCYDPETGRALYDQEAIPAELAAAGILPRPQIQGRKRAPKGATRRGRRVA